MQSIESHKWWPIKLSSSPKVAAPVYLGIIWKLNDKMRERQSIWWRCSRGWWKSWPYFSPTRVWGVIEGGQTKERRFWEREQVVKLLPWAQTLLRKSWNCLSGSSSCRVRWLERWLAWEVSLSLLVFTLPTHTLYGNSVVSFSLHSNIRIWSLIMNLLSLHSD